MGPDRGTPGWRTPGPRQPDLGGPEVQPPTGAWELADQSRIEVGRVREFAFLGLALWRRLGLHQLLESLIEPGREEVAWAGRLGRRRRRAHGGQVLRTGLQIGHRRVVVRAHGPGGPRRHPRRRRQRRPAVPGAGQGGGAQGPAVRAPHEEVRELVRRELRVPARCASGWCARPRGYR
jgi:hypothetical protein